MANNIMNGIRLVLRNDAAITWTFANPILLSGEVGIETDTRKMKVGDGTTNWNDLPYFIQDNSDTYMLVSEYVGVGATGSVYKADKLTTAREIEISGTILQGDAAGLFDGSQNIEITLSPTEDFTISMGSWNNAATNSHTHSNKTILDAITAAFTVEKNTKLANLANITTIGENLNLEDGVLSATDTTYGNATVGQAGLMSPSDKGKLDGITAGAKPNVIEEIQVNEVTQTPVDKVINIEVPTSPSDIGAAPLAHTQAISTITGLEDALEELLPLTGGTMSGAVYSRSTATIPYALNEFINRQYVDDKIAAAGAMKYMGTVGTGGTVATLPVSGVLIGDTYIVIEDGTYAGQVASIGDMFIAQNDDPIVWDLISSGNPSAVSSTNTLTTNQLIVGDGGNRGIKTLPIGTNNTILTVVEGVPTWSASNAITSIEIESVPLSKDQGKITLPLATLLQAGLVKSSAADNKVSVGVDGTMTINRVNAAKIFVAEGDVWVLNCGGANS